MGLLALLGGGLLKLALPAIGTVAAGLATALLKKQLAKVHIEITEAQEAQVKRVITDAVKSTEEHAHRNPGVLSPDDKAQMTMNIASGELPHVDPSKIRLGIDAALQDVRTTKSAVEVVTAMSGKFGAH